MSEVSYVLSPADDDVSVIVQIKFIFRGCNHLFLFHFWSEKWHCHVSIFLTMF